MKINFSKYHGAGNDFILIDNRKRSVELSAVQIALLCDRHFGVGADGLMLLQESDKNDFVMRYFNADGNEASLCGNGGRCIVSFARHLDIIRNKTSFMAVDGQHEAKILTSAENVDIVNLKMNDVDSWEKKGKDTILDTGSPHFIRLVSDVDEIDVFTEGRKIRNSATYGKDGINVNFVSTEEDGLKIRTYERGVENETLACGTGAVAAALSSFFDNYNSPVLLNASGGALKVSFDHKENKFTNIWLEGPATFVFDGEINI